MPPIGIWPDSSLPGSLAPYTVPYHKMILDIFTFIVLIVLVGAFLVLAAVLGGLPGKVAKQREHPQQDAINVCGWLGLITLGLLWPLALIWAYTNPTHTLTGTAKPAAKSKS